MNQILSRLTGALAITMLAIGIAAAQAKNTGDRRGRRPRKGQRKPYEVQ